MDTKGLIAFGDLYSLITNIIFLMRIMEKGRCAIKRPYYHILPKEEK